MIQEGKSEINLKAREGGICLKGHRLNIGRLYVSLYSPNPFLLFSSSSSSFDIKIFIISLYLSLSLFSLPPGRGSIAPDCRLSNSVAAPLFSWTLLLIISRECLHLRFIIPSNLITSRLTSNNNNGQVPQLFNTNHNNNHLIFFLHHLLPILNLLFLLRLLLHRLSVSSSTILHTTLSSNSNSSRLHSNSSNSTSSKLTIANSQHHRLLLVPVNPWKNS